MCPGTYSKRISGNTPPNHSNACTCSSKNACWVSTNDAWQNAAPENDARITNRCAFTDTPPSTTSASPQSTSASIPGAWTCGTNTSPTANPIARLRARTY